MARKVCSSMGSVMSLAKTLPYQYSYAHVVYSSGVMVGTTCWVGMWRAVRAKPAALVRHRGRMSGETVPRWCRPTQSMPSRMSVTRSLATVSRISALRSLLRVIVVLLRGSGRLGPVGGAARRTRHSQYLHV